MNKTLSTTLTVLTVIVLAGIIFFAGSLYARASLFVPYMTLSPGASAGVNVWNDRDTYSPGMMNGRAFGMMGNGRGYGMGPGMMGGYGYNADSVTPLTVEQTKAAAEKYLADLNNSDLQLAEIMIFEDNGYVIVREASTGIGAFELLVDPVSQIAYPEHGPNMMWNLRYSGLNHEYMMGRNGYGMMGGGMMRGYGWDSTPALDVSAEMTVTPEQAVEYAQQYLDAYIPGAAAEHPMQFFGYYTLDFEKDGKIAGMLSVNGYNGQVFLHTWHGTFIEEAEYE